MIIPFAISIAFARTGLDPLHKTNIEKLDQIRWKAYKMIRIQWKAYKMIRELLACEERLKNWSLFALERGYLQGDSKLPISAVTLQKRCSQALYRDVQQQS